MTEGLRYAASAAPAPKGARWIRGAVFVAICVAHAVVQFSLAASWTFMDFFAGFGHTEGSFDRALDLGALIAAFPVGLLAKLPVGRADGFWPIWAVLCLFANSLLWAYLLELGYFRLSRRIAAAIDRRSA